MQLTLAARVPLVLSWSLFFVTLARATLVPNAADLQNLRFDFIVVGGGDTMPIFQSCTYYCLFQVVQLETSLRTDLRKIRGSKFLFSRQDRRKSRSLPHSFSVFMLTLRLVFSNEGVLNAQIPFFCNLLAPGTPYDWNYTTTVQPGLGGRAIPYPRGHILGGSSSISEYQPQYLLDIMMLIYVGLDYLIYTRGSSDDFDRYAKVSGDSGWSWTSLQPYFKKNEKFGPPVDHHNTTGQFDPSVHGFNGINSVSLAGFPTPIDGRVINTTKQLAGDFPFNLDQNSGSPLGVGQYAYLSDAEFRF